VKKTDENLEAQAQRNDTLIIFCDHEVRQGADGRVSVRLQGRRKQRRKAAYLPTWAPLLRGAIEAKGAPRSSSARVEDTMFAPSSSREMAACGQ
jgi:hypothetical protein